MGPRRCVTDALLRISARSWRCAASVPALPLGAKCHCGAADEGRWSRLVPPATAEGVADGLDSTGDFRQHGPGGPGCRKRGDDGARRGDDWRSPSILFMQARSTAITAPALDPRA